jgi:glycolate oxidase FAD binding subunit
MEKILTQFRQRVVAASERTTPLRLRGGGSKDWYGQAPQGEPFDTRAYRGIVAYEPSELVITARCGTPLAEIEAALAAQNQMLAFEPPHFGPSATLGGMLACGLSGPRRQAVGAMRDFVLGATLMDGRGDVLRFGGQVMKNVAGYDVSRLLAGSLGTLGLILEASLKVLPQPYAEITLRLEMEQTRALDSLNTWGGQPLPISASAWQDGALLLRLSGAQAAIRSAQQCIGGETVADCAPLWRALREHSDDFFTGASDGAAALWRCSLPSAAPPLPLAGAQLIEWGGAQRWLSSDADATTVRAAVTGLGGHATRFRSADRHQEVFTRLAPAVAAIHRKLKLAFDPAGIFNPGRLYKDL